ncbi:T9SS type A sorting domain-containing protein [Flavobacterium sp. MK4S-17]|uniref:T9SS type A sorting domain-containing protein n=1 Tax=Flavobacterium sp. MK4S-17 TaxID=2543737 RepID=UPI00135A62B9|nr:T9SS type A sorting domain-containing protein [Flavobacterium sp. MK4S-17]
MKKTTSLLLFILFSFCAAAQTTRYVSPIGSPTATGLSWAEASTNLQAMINASSAGDSVWVAAGAYFPSDFSTDNYYTLKEGVKVFGGFPLGNPEFNDRDYTENETMLIGSTTSVIRNTNLTAATELDGFTIRDGFANVIGNSEPDQDDFLNPLNRGGGMYNDNSSPTLRNIIFKENTAIYGGALYNYSSSPTLTNVTFQENVAYEGGAVYNLNNPNFNISAPQFSNCSFNNNTASSNGGAITSRGGTQINLSLCTLTNNLAVSGGAIIVDANAKAIITNCTISFNNATGSFGGGAICSLNSVLNITESTFTSNTVNNSSYGGGAIMVGGGNSTASTINNVTFTNNSAVGALNGGAIFVILMGDGTKAPIVENCAFINNIAANGGGIALEQIAASEGARIKNSTFYNNVASQSNSGGGAIYNALSTGNYIYNCLFNTNYGQFGGAILNFNASSVIIANSSFTGNSAAVAGNTIANGNNSTAQIYNSITTEQSPIYNQSASNITTFYNCIVMGSGGSANWNSNFGTDGGNNIDADPMFNNIQLGDYSLQYGSPGIEAGNVSYYPGLFTDTDLAGNARFDNATIDIGAYEYQFNMGIDENKINKNSLVIYPNPVKDIMNIKTDTEIQAIEIYNTLGQLIKHFDLHSLQETVVNIKDLQSGNYLITVITDNGKITKQIIKQ